MPATWINELTVNDFIKWATLGTNYCTDPQAMPRLVVLAHFHEWGIANLENPIKLLTISHEKTRL